MEITTNKDVNSIEDDCISQPKRTWGAAFSIAQLKTSQMAYDVLDKLPMPPKELLLIDPATMDDAFSQVSFVIVSVDIYIYFSCFV